MKKPHDEVVERFYDICRKVGMKATNQRLAVFRYLQGNKEHPGVDAAWLAVRQELPTISRESVYRVLNDFASFGLITILDHPDTVARYDANPARHDHFYCVECGKFYDFEITELPELVNAAIPGVGRIDFAEVRVRGVCNECLSRKASGAEAETKPEPDRDQNATDEPTAAKKSGEESPRQTLDATLESGIKILRKLRDAAFGQPHSESSDDGR